MGAVLFAIFFWLRLAKLLPPPSRADATILMLALFQLQLSALLQQKGMYSMQHGLVTSALLREISSAKMWPHVAGRFHAGAIPVARKVALD
jgi:hypothetical protein